MYANGRPLSALVHTRCLAFLLATHTTTSKVRRKEKQNGYKQPAAFVCLECTVYHMQTWQIA
jgi:hypothetical protein